MAAFIDKVLVCRECGREFTFSSGEQAFYQEKGFTNEPAKCPECRKQGKQRRGMRGSAKGEPARRSMYKVVCADCGEETEVPFKPQTGRPVYCRDCFANHRH
ncbi:MAG: zinc-binding protein [Firmicutes bacterium]|nr:zinc-binding protein [Bacillota bacterium]